MVTEGAYGPREPLHIEQDPLNGIVTIEGTKFSYELLMLLGRNEMGAGQRFGFDKNEDGTVTATRIAVEK